MPGLNRKGPSGEGAMSGRKMGRCNPDNKGKTEDEILTTRKSILQSAEGNDRGLGRGSGRGLGQGSGQGLRLGKGMRRRGNA